MPPGPLTLDEAMRWAWQRGVAAIGRPPQYRRGRRARRPARADLLPQVCTATSDYSRQTVNLDEFGIPIATGVTAPFTCTTSGSTGSQTLVDPRRDQPRAVGVGFIRRVHDSTRSRPGAMPRRWPASRTCASWASPRPIRAREADSAIAADLLAQARQLSDAGISAAIDVTRNEVNSRAVRTQLVVTRNQLARAPARPGPRPERCRRRRRCGWPIHSARRTSALPTDQDSAVAFALGSPARSAGGAAPHGGGAAQPARGGTGKSAERRHPGSGTAERPADRPLAGTWASRSASPSRSSMACAARSAGPSRAPATTRRSSASTT